MVPQPRLFVHCGRVVTALEESQGLLSRLGCAYLGYITQGFQRVLWWLL